MDFRKCLAIGAIFFAAAVLPRCQNSKLEADEEFAVETTTPAKADTEFKVNLSDGSIKEFAGDDYKTYHTPYGRLTDTRDGHGYYESIEGIGSRRYHSPIQMNARQRADNARLKKLYGDIQDVSGNGLVKCNQSKGSKAVTCRFVSD
ncbi:MAG: hypothetical protein OXT65_00085 [Alphaproteobacteria bacterium]|nr:hypothetical protein [Alphaproteobacteria bacterium]